jgi:poly-gamma-glutamate synthesis protein (capsule biosynthesis protein)
MTGMAIGRRTLLAGAGAAVLAARAAAAAEPLKVTVFGQALIQHDLRQHPWPDFDTIAAMFGRADVAFTDLETALMTPMAGTPTREGVFTHVADPVVLDCLGDLRIGMLTQCNNHAFDLNSGGIVGALQAMDARGFVHAGTGRNLAEAAAPAYQRTPNGTVALVAMASGQIRPGGGATDSRPGVNEARQDPATGGLMEEDVQRVLAAVSQAASQADLVILYHHNHLLEKDDKLTPTWQQAVAKRGIDAGAGMFVSHGAPLLHGIEIYKGKPLFYGLGSLIFQSATEEGHYDDTVWQSVIAECRFEGGRFVAAQLTPVQMNAVGIGGPKDLETRGRPSLAKGEDAKAILANLATLSKPFGTVLKPSGETTVQITAS